MRISDWSSDVCSSDLSSAYVAVGYNPALPLFNLDQTFGEFIFNNPAQSLCGAAVAFGLSPDAAACVSQRLAVLASIKAGLAAETARTAAGGDALRRTNSGTSTSFIDRHTHETVVNRTELRSEEFGPLALQLKNIFGYQTTKGVTGVNIAGIPQDLEIIYVGLRRGRSEEPREGKE